jgi:quercetin dioxygenase-like cupin family protein
MLHRFDAGWSDMIRYLSAVFLGVGLSSGAAIAQPSTAPLVIKASDPQLTWGPCPPIFPGNCAIAVLHGDPAKPNADVYLRVGPGYVLPPHLHTSAERITLVTGELKLQYKGSPMRTVLAGDYAYGPATLPHQGKCVSKGPCTLFIAFELPVDAVATPAF